MSRSSSIRLANGMHHQARKRFGQNFLHDQAVIGRIIDSIDPQPDQHLLEIGPGQAALTRPLANSGARLDCVELDRDLAGYLEKEFRNQDKVTIHQQDILKFDLKTLVAEDEDTPRIRIIGNLPYNISTPVMFHLLQNHELISDMIFMLQLEVVQRLAAQPGDKNYGRLGLMAQYYCHIDHLFNVPSAAFTPQPKVSSAIVRLTPHQTFPVTAKDVGCLQTVIRTAFNQRRKTLKNALKGLISIDRLSELPVDLSQRPETLSLADFVIISDQLSEQETQTN